MTRGYCVDSQFGYWKIYRSPAKGEKIKAQTEHAWRDINFFLASIEYCGTSLTLKNGQFDKDITPNRLRHSEMLPGYFKFRHRRDPQEISLVQWESLQEYSTLSVVK